MSKKQIFSAQLFMENGKQCARLRNENQVTSVKVLLNVLDELRISRQIISGKAIQRDDHIDYIYEIKTDDMNKELFVIKIKNSEKTLFSDNIKYFDSLCDLSGTLRNVNSARIVAGLALGTIILITIGPAVIKLHKENNENQLRYQQEQYEKFLENINGNHPYYPTEEERKEAEKWYYENIESNELSENEITRKTM